MKTRRKKINKSPLHPFGGRAARPRVYVAEKGDMVTTTGIRGRTTVKRIVNEDGKRVGSARVVEAIPQPPAPKAVGERKPVAIFVGRVYTGVGRSKKYPERGAKRGGVMMVSPSLQPGLLGKMGRAIKRVIVSDDAA